jgi:hypothetical protein
MTSRPGELDSVRARTTCRETIASAAAPGRDAAFPGQRHRIPPSPRVRPRTSLLREGLDQKLPYRIHEEEVPRSGHMLFQAFQRSRWTNGCVFNWVGATKQIGRGEGHSGLAFDGIVPTGIQPK